MAASWAGPQASVTGAAAAAAAAPPGGGAAAAGPAQAGPVRDFHEPLNTDQIREIRLLTAALTNPSNLADSNYRIRYKRMLVELHPDKAQHLSVEERQLRVELLVNLREARDTTWRLMQEECRKADDETVPTTLK